MTIEWHHTFNPADLLWTLFGCFAILICFLPGIAIVYSSVTADKSSDCVRSSWPYLFAFQILSWCVWGYSLSFAPSVGTYPEGDPNVANPVPENLQEILLAEEGLEDRTNDYARGGLIGNFEFVFFRKLLPQGNDEQSLYPTRRPHHQIPHAIYLCYQLALYLAIPMPFLVCFSHRFSATALSCFVVLWTTMIYIPVAHWLWGEGWLNMLGAVDLGGGMMHIAVGVSGFTLMTLVRRDGDRSWTRDERPGEPNIASWNSYLGMGLFFLGACSINATSRFHADGVAMIAWLNSLVMVATAILATRGASLLIFGQTDSRDTIVGLLAGVTASAAGAGCLAIEPAVFSALIAGVLCSVLFRVIVKLDKSNVPCALFLVQFLGGALGSLMVGLFARANQSGQHWDGTPISGWIESANFELTTHQMLAIGATMGQSFVATLFLYQVIKRINKA